MKKVSCLLTVHNKESLIFDVCNGIKENISSSVDEIIVVLDGCTDSSESIVNQVFKDLKIKLNYVYTDDVFELKANNAGLKCITNDYVISR